MTPQTLFDLPPLPPPQAMRFNGPAYDPDKDRARLAGQIQRVYAALAAGGWWTLNELAQATGDPPASISAQLRHLRKPRFGSHVIDKQRRGAESAGLWEYRLVPSPSAPPGDRPAPREVRRSAAARDGRGG